MARQTGLAVKSAAIVTSAAATSTPRTVTIARWVEWLGCAIALVAWLGHPMPILN
jgi:hypothetical protein